MTKQEAVTKAAMMLHSAGLPAENAQQAAKLPSYVRYADYAVVFYTAAKAA